LVGTLDITAAIINFLAQGGEDISRIFKFIASGIFGQMAFEKGNSIILMGLLFHYLIAFLWTALFFYGYNRLKLRKVNAYIIGLLYGLIIWCVMNLLVLPLSNTPKHTQDLSQILMGMLILILCVGLPISIIYKRDK